MTKRWYTSAGLLLVASVSASVLLIRTWAGEQPNKKWPADKPPTEAENRATAESAKPVLDAIYRFNHENGLWPNALDELIPKYVKKEQVARWRYKTRQNGYWTLINYAGFPHTAVQFRYLKDKGGQWEVSWGDGEAELKVPYAPPKLEKLVAEEVNKNLLATMSKRIERYPGQIIHHKGLVTLLMDRALYAEAHKACTKCLEIWPDIWWPNVTLAILDIRLDSKVAAEKRMVAWADKHKDFIHSYFLAHYYQAAGETKKSLVALRRATELPIIHDWDMNSSRKDTGETLIWSNEVYLRYAAILAYKGKQTDLCLAVCKRWEKYVKEEQGYGDPGHAIFRAACLVNQGKGAEAVKLIDAVIEGPNYGYQFHPGVKALKKAAQENDSKHVFDPTRSGDGEYGYEKVGNELQLKVTYR